MGPAIYLTRRETFSACHRLHSHAMSDDKNRDVFSKCNNPNGHGHNYVVEVTVKGPVSPIDGMVMNISDLKAIMKTSIMDQLDHKNIDLDVAWFQETRSVSTTENLAVFIWNSLTSHFNQNTQLHKVKIWETEKNIVEYRGESN